MLFFIQMNASCADESRRPALDIFFSLGQFIKVHCVFRASATNHHCQNCMYVCGRDKSKYSRTRNEIKITVALSSFIL